MAAADMRMPKQWCYSKIVVRTESNQQTNLHRWQKKVWETGTQRAAISPIVSGGTTFAEYRPPTYVNASGMAAMLHIGQVRLEIQNGANEQTIEAVIRTVSRLC